MVSARLLLTGITARGRHGANPGEKDALQEFAVDLEVEVEVGADDLSSTADYRVLIRTARETVETRSFDLLESLAGAVAQAVVACPGVASVNAVVHKPAAARSNDAQDVAAAARAER